MPSRHAHPMCWGKIKYTQDEIQGLGGEIKCPACGWKITNNEVIDTTKLVDLIRIIRVDKHSKVMGLF